MTISYQFQNETVDDAVAVLLSGRSRMYKSPTGSGKSYMEVGVFKKLRALGHRPYLVVPSHEIACGIFQKMYHYCYEPKRKELEYHGIWTTKRLYNELSKANVPLPSHLIFDEGHHSVDNTHTAVWAYTGGVPRVSFTATDYRGTPSETARLREAWPDRKTVLTLSAAIDRGVISKPNFVTWPLLDDHLIDVVNGEFITKQVDSAVRDRLVDLVGRLAAFYDGALYDRATMVSFSSVEQVRNALSAFRSAGLPCVGVVGESGPEFESDRRRAFDKVVARTHLLLQVAVVGEGVDLPLRRLIDVAPTMSPLRWMQRVGRITRPVGLVDCPACHGSGDGGPECPLCHDEGVRPEPDPSYIACCHNFTRHSYLWHGVIPPSVIRTNQDAWPNFVPNRRDMARAIGLDGFGKFKVVPVPLADGTNASFYCLQTRDGLQQYAVLLLPSNPDPYYFSKTNTLTGERGRCTMNGREIEYNKKDWGTWKRIASLPELQDCVSIPPQQITPGMLSWWKGERGMKGAKWFGLDSSVTPDKRTFQVLPILANSKVKVTA